jgi:hypothetical protein
MLWMMATIVQYHKEKTKMAMFNGREKLGVLALWHEVIERKTVRQSTADVVKKYMPDEFDRLVHAGNSCEGFQIMETRRTPEWWTKRLDWLTILLLVLGLAGILGRI